MKVSEMIADLQNLKNEYGDVECINSFGKNIKFGPSICIRERETGNLYKLDSGDGIVFMKEIGNGNSKYEYCIHVD